MLTSDLLRYVLDIGEQMLISGAEVSRVEDSISRICKAYSAKRVDVLTITSSIVVTVQMGQDTFTQTRRIHGYSINLYKLDKLNNLSRYICKYTPDLSYIHAELGKIRLDGSCKLYVQYMAYATIAGAFTVFFGGSLADAAVSSVTGMLLKLLVTLFQKADKNTIFVNTLSSFVIGILAKLTVYAGIGNSIEKIIIGNIMLLIPGLALTNSVRDIIKGDTISGSLRLSEATIIALSIAVGFVIAQFALALIE